MTASSPRAVHGAVLAGGHGSRMGGPKALLELAGRPLASYPLAALREAGLEPALVAPAGVELEGLGAPVWREPAAEASEGGSADPRGSPGPRGSAGPRGSTRHPARGVICALERAGAPVVVLACDLPFVPPALVSALAGAQVSTRAAGQPLIARYEPADLPTLRDALSAGAPLLELPLAELELEPFGDPALIARNVNTPADLKAAAALLQ